MSGGIDFEAVVKRALAGGEWVAVARVVGAEPRLVVWARGETVGDLGSPRLNQRVALHAEQLIEARRDGSRRFDIRGGRVEVEIAVHGPSGPTD